MTDAKHQAPLLTLPGEDAPGYDIEADRQATVAALTDSPEIDALTSLIDVSDLNTIVTFGSAAAEDIARASDQVLRSLRTSHTDDSDKLLNSLADLMAQFDPTALQKKQGFFARLRGAKPEPLDETIRRFDSLSGELEGIYVRLKMAEQSLRKANEQLEVLFQANIGRFHELEKYIVAGEQGIKEIREYAMQRTEEMHRTNDASIGFELQTLSQAQTMLERRTQDLRMAENVALQSIPMVKLVEFSNAELMRKMDSALIVTLPVFKQALAQVILSKRRQLQQEALSRVTQQATELQQSSNSAEEALTASWQTVRQGVTETRALQEKTRHAREADEQRLQEIQRQYAARMKR